MIDTKLFKDWLKNNTAYSDAVVSDIVSRMNRADNMLEWEPTTTYLYKLEQTDAFQKMSVSVKSQVRRAVKYYVEFIRYKSMKL
jgi:hypothetical protein